MTMAQRVTTTCVPTPTRPKRSLMSALYMRMQPYDTKPPTELGTLVPWIAYCPPERVMAATPMGFRGEPPGMTLGRLGWSCFTSAGGDQAGCRYLPSMVAVPAQALPAFPPPTGERTARPPS